MPTIRISGEVYDALKARAEPFVDTPNDVIARMLHKNGAQLRGDRSTEADSPAATNTHEQTKQTRQADFEEPILQALRHFGGSARKVDVVKRVGEQMADRLHPGDYRTVSTGEPRWVNALAWQSSQMRARGILRSDTPRGTWTLAEEHMDNTGTVDVPDR